MASSWRVVFAASLLAACAKGNGPTSAAPVPVTVAPSPGAGGVADEGPVAESAPDPKASARATGSCELEATLRSDGVTRDGHRFVLALTNKGSKPLRLVIPGDGSESGWRTPVVTWSATANGKPAAADPMARCGLMNRIEKDEVFTLAPGASREIREWLPPLSFPAGNYAVRLTYRNDPSLATARGSEDAEVQRLLAATSACEVTTNALDVTVP